MDVSLNKFRLTCGFCGKRKEFKEIEQVSLRIDKNAKDQFLVENMCDACDESKEKKTLSGQSVRVFTGRSKHTDEQTVFDEKDGGIL